MLKKIFISVCLLLIPALNCFGEDYKLPPEYKIEIEKVIDNNLTAYKNKIDNKVFISRKIYESYTRDDSSIKNKMKYIEALEDCLSEIESVQFIFYMKLAKTTDNFVPVTKHFPASDNAEIPYSAVMPYLKANMATTKQIRDFDTYVYNNAKQIELYLENINQP